MSSPVPMRQRRQLVALLGGWAGCCALPPAAAAVDGAWAGPWPPQLAIEAPPDVDPAGWLVSEKFDGVRALWDGRLLRFRSGLPLAAPDGFTAQLPRVPLDGELWLGRGRFEAVAGLLRRAAPDPAGWQAVQYRVFDLPAADGPFRQRAAMLQALLAERNARAGLAEQAAGGILAVAQQPLADRAALQQRLHAVLAAGGEGLMLHRADAPWAGGRTGALLKLKPLHDAEALVLAHLPGHGRHAGRLGALRVRSPEGAEFSLGSGFSDAQRDNPPPQGSWVTYTHRGHTAAGLPRFASFLRLRGD